MSVGPAAAIIAERARSVAARLGDETAAKVVDLADRVDGALVVAVVGRLKTGKSTLVNAILGRDAAPVDGGECTRLVTRFRRGNTERVIVNLRDGSQRVLPLERGKVPSSFDRIDEIADLDVTLASSRLDDLVIVDTPGLASMTDDVSARSHDLIGTMLDARSQRVCADADALLYVVTATTRADDVAALTAFGSATGDQRHLSSVLVLNRADEVTGGLDAATEHAATLARRHRDVVATAVAATAVAGSGIRCGLVGTRHLETLERIAGLDDEAREELLMTVGAFCADPSPIDVDARVGLHEAIGFQGVVRAVDHLIDRPGDRVGALDAVEEWSRIGEVDGQVARLRRRADAIKAQHAVAALSRLAWSPAVTPVEATMLKSTVADLEAHPALAVVEQVAVLERAAAEPGVLSDVELEELDHLFGAGEVHARMQVEASADTAALAYSAARRWQAVIGGDESPARRHAAAVARSAYLTIWESGQLASGMEES